MGTYVHAVAIMGLDAFENGITHAEHVEEHRKVLRGICHRDRLWFTRNPGRKFRVRAIAHDEFPAGTTDHDKTYCVIVRRLTEATNARFCVGIPAGHPTPEDTDEAIGGLIKWPANLN